MKQEMQIPYPDRGIFLNEDKHTASVKEQVYTYMLDHFEYTPFKGVLTYIKGAQHPKKGFPTPEAVWAVNQVKVVMREALYLFNTKAFVVGFLFTFGKKSFVERVINSYITIADRSLKPYYFKEEYLCPTARGAGNTTLLFLVKMGFDQKVASDFSRIIAHVFEYDDAYRYRLQDIASALSDVTFKEDISFEIKRLLSIYRMRESNDIIYGKVRSLVKIVLMALKVKKVKETLCEAVLFGIHDMRYDEADLYWVAMRGDYLFNGLTYEERYEALEIKPQQYKVIHE